MAWAGGPRMGIRHHLDRGSLCCGWLAVLVWAGAPVSAQSLAALIQVQGQPLAGGRVSGSAVVPLEKARGGDTPVLTFSTDLGPVRLLLDTGATSSMVRPELAARLGLRPSPLAPGAFRLAGGGADCQSLRPQRLPLPPLRLGGLRLVGVEALMLPVAALPAGVDGVLGVPSLRLLPVAVDPLAQRLSLGPLALRPQPRQTLPLRWHRGVPLLSLITVAGRVEALADTGAEGLFLSPALAARLHPLNQAEPLEMVGFCGTQTVRRQTFAGLAFAPPVAAIQDQPDSRQPTALAPRAQVPGAQGQAALEQPREGIITENPIFSQLGVAAIVGQELLRQRPQLWRLDLKEPRLELW